MSRRIAKNDETAFSEQRTAFDGQQVLRTTLGYDSRRLELFARKEEDRRK
jgi:hypothetical protein